MIVLAAIAYLGFAAAFYMWAAAKAPLIEEAAPVSAQVFYLPVESESIAKAA